MSENKLIQELAQISDLVIRENVSAYELTSFKGGGVARIYLVPNTLGALIETVHMLDEFNIRPLIIGKGANTIIDDGGISLPLLSLSSFSEISVKDNFVKAGSGCSAYHLLQFAKNNELTGLEFLAGIPATVGGLVAMNAGSFGGEIKDKVVECEVLKDGAINTTVPVFSYRKGSFDGILLSATFNLDFSTKEEIQAEMSQNLLTRRKKQPSFASCGSVFKASRGVPAAVLIEQTGLKGYRIGGAEISKQHCNFVVNISNATATDFLSLVDLIQTSVHYEFGTKLETEFVLLKDNIKVITEL